MPNLRELTLPLPLKELLPANFAVAPAATPFTANLTGLSPAELTALEYHRRMLMQNLAQKNADNSYTTFRGAIVGTPEGETYMPTYWHGQVRDVPQAMRFMIKSGLKFPSYKTVDEALAAEQRIHKIMEQDVADYTKSQK